MALGDCGDDSCKGWLLDMNESSEIQRCDACGVFEDDWDAAEVYLAAEPASAIRIRQQGDRLYVANLGRATTLAQAVALAWEYVYEFALMKEVQVEEILKLGRLQRLQDLGLDYETALDIAREAWVLSCDWCELSVKT